MDASGLVSRSLLLSWDRPRYELLDQRGALLALLDEADGVEGFLPSQAGIDVRMRGGIALNMSTLGAWAYELTSEQDPSPTASALELLLRVGERLGARQCGVRLAFQHLMPWPGWQDEAVAARVAAENFLGEPDWQDFALLVDGRGPESWLYQAEFGVLGRSAVPERLSRRIGRVGRNAGAPQPDLEEEILAAHYPAVATFVDSSWFGTRLEFTLAAVEEEVAKLESEAQRLAQRCHDRVHVSLPKRADTLDTTEGMR